MWSLRLHVMDLFCSCYIISYHVWRTVHIQRASCEGNYLSNKKKIGGVDFWGFRISDFSSGTISFNTSLLLDTNTCRCLPLILIQLYTRQIRCCNSLFFEKCFKFLKLFRRLGAFPKLSCSPLCKCLLEVYQYSRKAFLIIFIYLKKGEGGLKMLEVGRNDKFRWCKSTGVSWVW